LRKSRFVSALAGITLFLVLAGCTSAPVSPSPTPSPSPVQTGPTLIRFGTTIEPARLNPAIYPSPADRQVTDLVYSRLLAPDKNMKLVNDLAEKYELSADSKTITFTIRKGVKWHDGQPFTANDVAFTFKSLAHPNYAGGQTAWASAFRGAKDYREGKAQDVEGIVVLNEHTIRFSVDTVHGPLMTNFTHPILPQHILGSVDPAVWDKHPTNVSNPIGTGPYKMVRFAAQQFVELEANPDYFRGRPNIDRLIWVLGESNALISSLITGNIDVMSIPVTEARNIQTERNLEVKQLPANTFFYMGFNMANKVLEQQPLRVAFAHAIDREQICQSALRGYCDVVNVPMPIPMWSYSAQPGYKYDPAMARQMLDNLGWRLNAATGIREKDGQRLQFEMVYSADIMSSYAPLIQENLKAVGIGISLVKLDWPTMVDTKLLPKTDGQIRLPKGDELQIWLLSRTLQTEPLAEQHYHCNFSPPKGFNFTQYCDPALDVLFDRQLATMDFAERARIYADIMKSLSEKIPWIPLYSSQDLYAHNTRLQNFEPGINSVTQNIMEWKIKP